MSFTLLLALCIISLYGTASTGCFTSLFGYIALTALLVFLWVHKLFVFITLAILITVPNLINKIDNYLKYKDETPEERAERLKTEKMISDWRNRNNF